MYSSLLDITLAQVLKKNHTRLYKASPGENSHVHRLVGEAGADLVIPVPVGVTVYSQTGVKLGWKNVDLLLTCLTYFLFIFSR